VDAFKKEHVSIPVSLRLGTITLVNNISAVHDAFRQGVEEHAYPSAPSAERDSIQSLASHHDCATHNEHHDDEIQHEHKQRRDISLDHGIFAQPNKAGPYS
jgi:hypothetical protein